MGYIFTNFTELSNLSEEIPHGPTCKFLSELCSDKNCLIVAGISAGGTFAIDLAIRQIIPVTGFMVFCPGIPTILSESFNLDMPGVRGYMLGGEEDHYLSRQKKMEEIFDREGLSCRHEILEGMGHQYPPEESRWIEEALYFVEHVKSKP